jgi:hypothetical protein
MMLLRRCRPRLARQRKTGATHDGAARRRIDECGERAGTPESFAIGAANDHRLIDGRIVFSDLIGRGRDAEAKSGLASSVAATRPSLV